MATTSGDMTLGQRWSEEALELYRRFGNDFGEGLSLWQLGYIRLERGDLSTAQEMLIQAVELLRQAGDENNLRWATRTLAFIYLTMGDLEHARPLYEENLRCSRDSGDQPLVAASLGGLSGIALQQGRLTDAVAFQRESLRLVIHLNDELMAISRFCVAASVLAAVDRAEAAATLIGYAEARYEETATHEPWVVRMNDETLAAVRTKIGDSSLAAAKANGAVLTSQNALELAVAEMQAASEGLRE